MNEVLYLVTAIVLGGQWLVWGIILRRCLFSSYQENPVNQVTSYPSLAIVVCARNEAEALRRHLPQWIAQDYAGAWELWIVDDDSQDATPSVVAVYAAQTERLRYRRLSAKAIAGKKGVLQAILPELSTDWVLLTDADCWPLSPHWARSMVEAGLADPRTEIVLGYGWYDWRPDALHTWVHCETLHTAMLYTAFARWGRAYMGVGRNLLYRSDLLRKAHWQAHAHLLSGDDDLTVQQLARPDNVAVCMIPDAATCSWSPRSWRGLYRQKTRHYSTATHYPWLDQLLLGFIHAGQLLYYPLLIGGWYQAWWTGWELGLWLGGRMLLMAMCWQRAAAQHAQKKIEHLYWFFDFFAPFYYLAFLPSLFLKNRTRWI